MSPPSTVSLPRTARTSTAAMLRRRLVTVPLAVLGFPIVVALSPLLFAVAGLVDLVVAPRRFPSVRLLAAVVGYWAYAFVAQFRLAWLWTLCGFGARNWEPKHQARNHEIIRWWTQGLVAMFGPTLGIRFEIENEENLSGGPLLVFPRHVSITDAFFGPAMVLRDPSMRVRLVMTRELRMDPQLDVAAHRTPHHFVARGGGGAEAEIEAVGRLAEHIDETIAVVVYPEGGLYRPAVRDKIISRFEETDPAAAERARQLTHLLPIRAGGPLELLRRAPEGTDVVLLGHVGFDQLTDPKTMWRNLPLRAPVLVTAVRLAADEIPDGDDARLAWLQGHWQGLNDWVAEASDRRAALLAKRRSKA